MAGVTKFEDLKAWQKSCEMARMIYRLTRKGTFSRDNGLKYQIQRAAVSVISNIAEGFERGSRSDFHHFLVIVKASCAEVCSQLYLAYDIGYLTNDEFRKSMDIANETARIIGGLRRSGES